MKKSPLFALLALTTLSGCSQARTTPQYGVVKDSYIHQYGVAVSEKEWNERGQNGKVIRTFENGVTTTKNYKEGVYDGLSTQTFPHSSLIEKEEVYADGHLVKKTLHYSSGSPKREEEWPEEGVFCVTSWYPDGMPMLAERYEEGALLEASYFTLNNEVEATVVDGFGSRVLRDMYGQRQSIDIIENGQLALSTTYFPNGAPESITPYMEGVIAGERKTFLQGGEPLTIEEWANGKQDGTTLVFENGIVCAEVPYKRGNKHGIEKRFGEGGQIVEEITWERGLRQGPTHIVVADTLRTDWYYGDELVSKAQYEMLRYPSVRA